MKKKKLYILISIATLLLIFTVAATCSFCGTSVKVGEKDSLLEDQDTETQSQSQSSQQSSQQTQGEPEAPTLELKISEGPLYSAEDDVCFWRVEAVVSGNPKPDINWSKDDSRNRLGDNIAQINLTRDEPEYTLVCTVENSVDTVTEDITLSWDCDGEGNNGGDNNCPEISIAPVFASYDGTIPCDRSYYFVCYAQDTDGDELTFDWGLSGGIDFSVSYDDDPLSSTIDFTTPSSPTTITLSVTVSDGICEESITETIDIICD